MEIDENLKNIQESETEVEAGKEFIKETLTLEEAAKRLARKKIWHSRLLVVGIIVAIVGCIIGYLISDFSNVRSVKVINNSFLSAEYIMDQAGISTESDFIFIFPKIKELSLRSDPLIKDVKITRGPNHSVVIDVTENGIVGYRYEEKMQLILGDGSFVDFKSKYISNLSLLPMFMSVPEEKIKMVAERLAELDPEVVMRISEVRDYALSYDENMIKFVMEDGYAVYSSMDGISYLKDYLSIIKNTGSSNKCIYFDTENKVAVMRSCSELEELYRRHLDGDEPEKTEGEENTETEGQGTGE